MRISDWSSDVCSSDLLDEAGRTIVARLDFKPVVADFQNGDGDGLVLLQRARTGASADGGSALLKLLDAQADAFLLDIDVQDDYLHHLALQVKEQRFRARDAPSDIRHVNHAIDVAGQTNEQTHS